MPDWEESERLANEKEVLGFFVSGHPLDKYAEKIRNLTAVIPISEAIERKPAERRWGKDNDPADEVQVAGIIHGLRVQKSKRDQKLYAQAALEDATGKIDLICFARDYERLCEQLKIEAPVLSAAPSWAKKTLPQKSPSAAFNLSKTCRSSCPPACASASTSIASPIRSSPD